MMRRPIVLIGLPGAGKSTVAPLAAELLGAPWCDLDAEIVAAAGQSIPEIFAAHGEAHFRRLEREAMARAIATEQVIAAGAGWMVQTGNLAAISPRALTIYMSLTPDEAAQRVGNSTGRPMLGNGVLAAELAALFAAREMWYRLADLEIVVGHTTPEAVAAGIATAARQYGGW